jgi:5-methylcytosine-specific restriction endonuclease McrA
MPANPFRRACVVAGCPRPVHVGGKCAVHARQADALRGLDSDRHLGAALYQTREWRALRDAVLALHPFCECARCVTERRRERATVVHHVEPHGGNPRRFWDPHNLLALSAACHAALHAAARSAPRPSPGLAGGGRSKLQDDRPVETVRPGRVSGVGSEQGE